MAINAPSFYRNATLTAYTSANGSTGSTNSITVPLAPQVTVGTSAGQANLAYYPPSPTAGTGGTSYDLNGGSLVSIDGTTTADFTNVGKILVIHRGTTGTITVGGGTNAIMAAQPPVGPGGAIDYEDFQTGITVTGGSNDVLKVTASAGTIPIEVLVVGR